MPVESSGSDVAAVLCAPSGLTVEPRARTRAQSRAHSSIQRWVPVHRAVGPTFGGMGSGNEGEDDLDGKEEEGIHSLMVRGWDLTRVSVRDGKILWRKLFSPSPPLSFPLL